MLLLDTGGAYLSTWRVLHPPSAPPVPLRLTRTSGAACPMWHVHRWPTRLCPPLAANTKPARQGGAGNKLPSEARAVQYSGLAATRAHSNQPAYDSEMLASGQFCGFSSKPCTTTWPDRTKPPCKLSFPVTAAPHRSEPVDARVATTTAQPLRCKQSRACIWQAPTKVHGTPRAGHHRFHSSWRSCWWHWGLWCSHLDDILPAMLLEALNDPRLAAWDAAPSWLLRGEVWLVSSDPQLQHTHMATS